MANEDTWASTEFLQGSFSKEGSSSGCSKLSSTIFRDQEPKLRGTLPFWCQEKMMAAAGEQDATEFNITWWSRYEEVLYGEMFSGRFYDAITLAFAIVLHRTIVFRIHIHFAVWFNVITDKQNAAVTATDHYSWIKYDGKLVLNTVTANQCFLRGNK